jgi:hypothetical protein
MKAICEDHVKAFYIVQGNRLMVSGSRTWLTLSFSFWRFEQRK